MKPRRQREVAKWVHQGYGLSERRETALIQVPRGTMRYCARRDPQVAFRVRLKELAACAMAIGV